MGPYDWKYVYFHPCLGMEFREIAVGNYELCVKHDKQKENERLAFTILPDLKEYGTRDLFQQHPTIPELWSWRARADDIIVFLNGEKTNPNSMEQHIVAHNPEVLAAIVVGIEQFQASLMIEPASSVELQTTAEEAALIEKIWPSIEEANQIAPAHTRIEKAMILLMSPKKPVIRAEKGTIQRAATIQQYSVELDKLYQNADTNFDAGEEIARSADVNDIDSISQLVKTIVGKASGKPEIDYHVNFFATGMDSLQALKITRMLRYSLGIPEMALATVYGNPFVAELSKAIQNLQANKEKSEALNENSHVQLITSMLGECQDLVRKIPQPTTRNEERPEKRTIVLTGSTGNLGTCLLDTLLKDPGVDHVYCLNRRENSRDLQAHRNRAASLPLLDNDSRVSFHKVDRAQTNLALPTELFAQHLPAQLTGLLNLFSLSASARYRPAVFFISSISSVLGLRTPSRLTPEEVITDIDAPFGSGYAESKFISEILCNQASQKPRILISIARVGQIAGPVRRKGLWNPTKWVPSLIMSSVHIGALPDRPGDTLNKIDWIPVDLLAEIIVDLAIHEDRTVSSTSSSSGAEVLHLQSPKFTSWEALLPDIKTTIEPLTSKPIAVVPAKSWLAKVRQGLSSAARASNGGISSKTVPDEDLETLLKVNPAVKLLEFFSVNISENEQANILDLECTLSKSPFLKGMNSVSIGWIRKWVSEWLLT